MSASRLNVVHLTLGLATGGQEKLLVEFARCADRERFALTFVSLTGGGPVAEAIAGHGWPVVTLGEKGGVRPSLVWRLRKTFRSLGADVVHTHDDRPLVYGVPAARLAGARAIHTHHHGWLPSTSKAQTRLTRWAGNWAHAFVVVSHDAARHLQSHGAAGEKLQTIWNGIDLERFAYAGPALGGPAVCVARLSPEKNVANLVRASARVLARDPSFRLEIAGDGPCREDLVRLAADLGVTGAVRFLGEVRDVPSLLARAGLFVLPSKTEGISLTLLEAMARGLPVVTTRVGGNPEVVVDGQTGRLVPSEDSEALASALLHVRESFETATLLGRAGRRRVEDCFDVRRMVARYEALYRDQPAEPALATPERERPA